MTTVSPLDALACVFGAYLLLASELGDKTAWGWGAGAGAAGSSNTAGSPYWLPDAGVTPKGGAVEKDHLIAVDYTCAPTSAPTSGEGCS